VNFTVSPPGDAKDAVENPEAVPKRFGERGDRLA
jgi:hypothetical protein